MELIVAVDRDWGIGYRGQLLARLRADMRHFRALTEGKTVILGSNTLSTFPGGKPLKNRRNIILHPDPSYLVDGALVLHSLDELFSYISTHPDERFVAIGGASVYRQLLPYCAIAHVTKFDRSFEKDVYFDNLDVHPDWALTEIGEPQQSDPATDSLPDLVFRFCTYRRIGTL